MIDTPEDSAQMPIDPVAGDGQFRCDVSFLDEHAVIDVRGELDLATAPELLRELQGTLVLPLSGVAVDLSALTFLDSSGIHTLLVGKANADERGIEFTITAVSRPGRYVLDIAGLTAHFGIDAP
jgi:anti-sigma B factor antagonist